MAVTARAMPPGRIPGSRRGALGRDRHRPEIARAGSTPPRLDEIIDGPPR
jgi:hypothetical protein